MDGSAGALSPRPPAVPRLSVRACPRVQPDPWPTSSVRRSSPGPTWPSHAPPPPTRRRVSPTPLARVPHMSTPHHDPRPTAPRPRAPPARWYITNVEPKDLSSSAGPRLTRDATESEVEIDVESDPDFGQHAEYDLGLLGDRAGSSLVTLTVAVSPGMVMNPSVASSELFHQSIDLIGQLFDTAAGISNAQPTPPPGANRS